MGAGLIPLLLAFSVLSGPTPGAANEFQGADAPDAAIEGYQKALREKKWDTVYDWQAPAERQRLEKEFKERNLPHVEEVLQLLGITKEELFKLTTREFYVKLPQKLEEMEPGYFAPIANAKFEKKTKEGEDWLYEHQEKTLRNNIPTTTNVSLMATREGGKWYIVQPKGGERASNERNAEGTLRDLAAAEADFKTEDRDADGKRNYWVADVRGLFTLKGRDGAAIRLIETSAAGADAAPSKLSPESPELKSAPKAGYYYIALKAGRKNGKATPYDEGKGRNDARFGFAAYPEKYGGTGKLTYILSEAGIVWKKDTGGKVPDAFPEDPAKDGWERLE